MWNRQVFWNKIDQVIFILHGSPKCAQYKFDNLAVAKSKCASAPCAWKISRNVNLATCYRSFVCQEKHLSVWKNYRAYIPRKVLYCCIEARHVETAYLKWSISNVARVSRNFRSKRMHNSANGPKKSQNWAKRQTFPLICSARGLYYLVTTCQHLDIYWACQCTLLPKLSWSMLLIAF